MERQRAQDYGGETTPRVPSEDLLPITISQVLDLLMALVLIMFVPIGLWRGALREWLTLAGITLGLLLAGSWSDPWGADLAAAAGMDPNLAAFTVAALFFLGTTVVVGYGAGVTLPYRPDLTGANRFLGALLGLGNGTLILSGVLQIMQRHLFASRDDSPLKTAGLASFLIDSVGWVYLGLLALFIGCVAVGLARRWTEGAPLMDEYGPVYQAAARDEWRPEEIWSPTVPPVKPTTTATEPPARDRANQETAVLKVVPTVSQSVVPEPSSTAVSAPTPTNAAPATPPRVDHPEASTPAAQVVNIARRQTPRPAPPPLPANVTPIGAHSGRAPNERRADEQKQTGARITADPPTLVPRPRTDGDAPTLVPRPAQGNPPADTVPAPVRGATSDQRTCGSCGTPTAPRARFCLICGHLIGDPERRQVARQP